MKFAVGILILNAETTVILWIVFKWGIDKVIKTAGLCLIAIVQPNFLVYMELKSNNSFNNCSSV